MIVSSPARQHSYETALAAMEGDFRARYITSFYDTGRGFTGLARMKWLPARFQNAIVRKLDARRHPELRGDAVTTRTKYHFAAYALRAPLQRLGQAQRFERWAHWRFDAAVARWLKGIDRADVVHAFENAALRTFHVARQRGIACILDAPSAHEYFLAVIAEEGGEIRHLEQFAQARAERELADYILAPSEYVRECLLEHGASPAKLRLVPYGVDTASFNPRERQAGSPFRALFVGQIGHRKGVRYLLEAWRAAALPYAELTLVGKFDEGGESILREFEGSCRVLGPRPRSEMSSLYAESDVFVFPSLAEGSALVTYEAMASGLPVITTPNAGSVVRDGVEGWIVPPRDVKELGARITSLYEDGNARVEMGVRGRALMESEYTWAHYRERVRAIYREAIARRRGEAADAFRGEP